MATCPLQIWEMLNTKGMSFNDPFALVGPKINFGKCARSEFQVIYREAG